MSIWFNDLNNLFNSELFPSSYLNNTQNVNSLTNLSLIVCIVLAIHNKNTQYLYLGIYFIALLGFLYFLFPNKMSENFQTNYSGNYVNDPYQIPFFNYNEGPEIYRVTSDILSTDPYSFLKDPVLRNPTENNPFMNVMPLDYSAVPIFENHKDVTKIDTMKQMNDEFKKGLYQNASGLLWNRNNSQRQFISQPVTSVPNNQTEFANWLYSPNEGLVCKSGSIWDRYGFQFTNDSLSCNGFNASSPTNNGLLNGNLMSSVAFNSNNN